MFGLHSFSGEIFPSSAFLQNSIGILLINFKLFPIGSKTPLPNQQHKFLFYSRRDRNKQQFIYAEQGIYIVKTNC